MKKMLLAPSYLSGASVTKTKKFKNVSRKFDLQVHIQNIHEKTVEYKCEVCDKNFSSKAYMKRHSKVCFNKVAIIHQLKL
jgi:hypothetical protein